MTATIAAVIAVCQMIATTAIAALIVAPVVVMIAILNAIRLPVHSSVLVKQQPI